MNVVEEYQAPEAVLQFNAYLGEIEKDEDGNVVNDLVYESPEIHNLVVNTGKNGALDRIFGTNGPPAVFTCVGVGNSATAAATGDTLLIGASTLILQSNAATDITRSSQTSTLKHTFGTAQANFSWQEIAIFNNTVNATTASTMFNRIAPIGPFNKTTAVSIVTTLTVVQT